MSVCCLTYNQEKYVRDVIEGFLSQKTDFIYEVWIHDDASTDNTAKIVKEYAEKYPQIIKPICQTENLFSQGINILEDILCPLFNGKYIAFCEGDDYWCDENKLQRQVQFMEEHIEYSACVHNTKSINCRNNEIAYFNDSETDMDLNFDKVVMGGGVQFHTSSLLCKKEYICVPKEIAFGNVGDYPLAVYLMFKGKIRYLHQVMSVYRLYAEGSRSAINSLDSNVGGLIEYNRELVDFAVRLKAYIIKNDMQQGWAEAVEKLIQNSVAGLLELDNSKLMIEEYQELYKRLSLKQKVKVRFPNLIKFFRRIRR